MPILTRQVTSKIIWVVDNLLPPIVRDSKWFSWLLIFPVAGSKTSLFFRFKEHVNGISEDEFADYYRETSGLISRDTDLSNNCLMKLDQRIRNEVVLEVGCGNGFLLSALVKHNKVVGCDISVPQHVRDIEGLIGWDECRAESLPYPDGTFDVVVSTHMLEHVRDFEKALSELRRVARRKLYIVVPLQRPYKYTADLHIWFFPYPLSFINRARPNAGSYTYDVIDGDLFYEELQ